MAVYGIQNQPAIRYFNLVMISILNHKTLFDLKSSRLADEESNKVCSSIERILRRKIISNFKKMLNSNLNKVQKDSPIQQTAEKPLHFASHRESGFISFQQSDELGVVFERRLRWMFFSWLRTSIRPSSRPKTGCVIITVRFFFLHQGSDSHGRRALSHNRIPIQICHHHRIKSKHNHHNPISNLKWIGKWIWIAIMIATKIEFASKSSNRIITSILTAIVCASTLKHSTAKMTIAAKPHEMVGLLLSRDKGNQQP